MDCLAVSSSPISLISHIHSNYSFSHIQRCLRVLLPIHLSAASRSPSLGIDLTNNEIHNVLVRTYARSHCSREIHHILSRFHPFCWFSSLRYSLAFYFTFGFPYCRIFVATHFVFVRFAFHFTRHSNSIIIRMLAKHADTLTFSDSVLSLVFLPDSF